MTAGPVASQLHERVRTYDFRRPDKFSKDQLRTLQMLHENQARLLTTAFSGIFRTLVEVTVLGVEQESYDEFARGVTNPSIMAILGVPPLKGNIVLDVSPAIAFPMVDRLFGGTGQSPPEQRPLTEIEQSAISRVLESFLATLDEAWAPVFRVQASLQGIESNPLFTQVVTPNETIALVGFQVRLGMATGELSLALPYITVAPLLPRLVAHQWEQPGVTPEKPARGNAHLVERLGAVEVPVDVVLGRTRLTVDRFLSLQPGDVLELDTAVDDLLPMRVAGTVKFWGRPGRVGRRLGFMIAGSQNGGGTDHE